MQYEAFRVSAALKDIIGRDLITDDFVAVFELVKNAFDAYASKIDIEFDDDTITIVDDGKGMSRDDVLSRWLFVAYSAKADESEDDDAERDYRNRLKIKRGFAGSKGIGRFSCDRLGRFLDLYAIEDGSRSITHLKVDWTKFEAVAQKEIGKVRVGIAEVDDTPRCKRAQMLGKHGVMLQISGLRGEWDGAKVAKLRSYLARLVDPFSTASDLKIRTFMPAYGGKEDVSGVVGNDIAAVLEQKTTKIEAVIEDGTITSTLIDRGTLVYKIQETIAPESSYAALAGAKVVVTIYYLNRSAKKTFTTRMQIEPVRFGHLFLFLNGFRIYPIGEPTDDTFGIARRKQQGTSRFLGLRDIMGTVRVTAEPGRRFREASSRDNGLIQNEAVDALYEAVDHAVFRRLERYVTKVAWPDSLEQDRDDATGLRTNAGRARVIDVVKSLAGARKIRLLDYDRHLVDVVEERANEFEKTMGSLVSIAESAGDEALLQRVEQSRARYQELRASEKE
ncbi:MAG: ATP-binding protein, partial [Pseudomonadota bacterium]